MSKESIKTSINTYIKENGNLAITGQILNSVMNEMVDGLASEEELAEKQDALTLTTKDNGNIVIANIQGQSKEFMPATPSGDPMHWAYVAVGAEWNDTDEVKYWTDPYGETYPHQPHKWRYRAIGDIDNNEMRVAYIDGIDNGNLTGKYYQHKGRFNIYKISGSLSQAIMSNCFYRCETIEVIDIGDSARQTPGVNGLTEVKDVKAAFYNCSKLHTIYGEIYWPAVNAITDNTFFGCTNLKHLTLRKIIGSISFSDSPNLDLSDLAYMIREARATTSQVITLHPDVYNKAIVSEEVQSALSTNKYYTIASA